MNEYQRALRIIACLQGLGFEALIVGGWVRDRLLGIESADVDIVTNARTHEIMKIWPGDDSKIGVGTNFLVNIIDGIEVATYRLDQIDEDGETTVLFAECFKDDSERRDLTINAIGYDPIADKYIDHWGGIDDLKLGVIRFVNSAQLRIEEDPARMLRAARFVAKTEFKLLPSAFLAIKDNAELINTVPKERIQKEILKALDAELPSMFFEILHNTGVLNLFAPELDDCWYHDGGNHHPEFVHEHLLSAGDAVHCSNKTVRLAAYLHDIGKVGSYNEEDFSFVGHEKVGTDLARTLLIRLKFDNDTINTVCSLILVHMRCVEPDSTPRSCRRTLAKLEEKNVSLSDFLILKIVDRHANAGRDDYTQEDVNQLIDNFNNAASVDQGAFSVNDVAINGNDIINSGVRQGKGIGNILKYYFDLVLDNPEYNEREHLLHLLNEVDDWDEYK